LTNFPKARKKEVIQSLHDIFSVCQNKLSSQSLPKYTLLTLKEMEVEYDELPKQNSSLFFLISSLISQYLYT